MDHDQSNDHQASQPATFAGRLKLDDFAYAGSESAPRRSSPRLSGRLVSASTPSSSSQAPTPTEDAQTTPSSKKRKRPSAGYAPPSTYAHLPLLPDALADNLLVLFVGLNPGIRTARTGHAYNHPSNLFWKLLHSSGVTPRRCAPEEDGDMPRLYSLGLTNIVSRPSRNGGELSKGEMDEGVSVLEEKAARWRPETVCIVGKSIWESVWRVRHGGKAVGKAFRYGWQDESENMGVVEGEWPGARVFVATSTSGLAASLSPAEKQAIWSELGVWVQKRRAEREEAPAQGDEDDVDESE
jgi:thymine-DNA glycosylase